MNKYKKYKQQIFEGTRNIFLWRYISQQKSEKNNTEQKRRREEYGAEKSNTSSRHQL